jgi:hypothetical protein
MIRAAGFQDVHVRVDEFAFQFRDADAWWRWAGSHGFRQILDQMPAQRLAIYRRTAFEHIGQNGIGGRMEALIAVAARR